MCVDIEAVFFNGMKCGSFHRPNEVGMDAIMISAMHKNGVALQKQPAKIAKIFSEADFTF